MRIKNRESRIENGTQARSAAQDSCFMIPVSFRKNASAFLRGLTPSVNFGDAQSRGAKGPSPKLTAGFTLIETFVAITILVTAVVGPLSIASTGLYSASVASDQIIATFLAQDGIEYVRATRDSNTLSGQDWLSGLSSCVSAGGTASCYFDSTVAPGTPGSVAACTGACPVMYFNSTSNFYNYAPGSGTNVPSKFTRQVSIQSPVCAGSVCSATEAAISSTVSWKTNSLTHTFTVRENMFNWQ